MYNHALDSKRVVVFPATVAAATTLTSAVYDMQEFASVELMVLLGAVTAGQVKGTVQVFAGNAANGSDAALLAGATITIQDADATKMEVLEVVKPAQFRYLTFVITRNAQAAAIQSVVAMFNFAGRKPTSDDATTVAQTLVCVDPEYVNAQLTVVTTTYPGSTTQVANTYRSAS